MIMMKNIHVLILLLSVQSPIFTTQESHVQKSNAQIRNEIIDQATKDLPMLVTCFNFLQEHNVSNQSFHEYVTEHLNHATGLECNFGQTIEKAEDVILAKIRDPFFTTMHHAIHEKKALNTTDDPLLLFMIQHKDGCMNFFIQQWVNQTDPRIDNGTLLHQAIAKKNLECVDLLITLGANINTQNKSGWTPLYAATFYNHTEIADILIAAGADLNIPDHVGETALHCATLADLNTPEVYRQTTLDYTKLTNSEKIALKLIAAGADLNCKDKYGCTPLYRAYSSCKIVIVQMLITAGAHINIKNNEGNTIDDNIFSPEIHALFKQVRQKNDDQKIAIFENQI